MKTLEAFSFELFEVHFWERGNRVCQQLGPVGRTVNSICRRTVFLLCRSIHITYNVLNGPMNVVDLNLDWVVIHHRVFHDLHHAFFYLSHESHVLQYSACIESCTRLSFCSYEQVAPKC